MIAHSGMNPRVHVLVAVLIALGSLRGLADDSTTAKPLRLAGEAGGWRVQLTEAGHIAAFEAEFDGVWEPIPFHGETDPPKSDEAPTETPSYAGPRWYGHWDGQPQSISLRAAETGDLKFEGSLGDLNFSLQYKSIDDRLALIASVANAGREHFEPTKLGLKLGLDTTMAPYPDWRRKMFPTLLRCEPTHFWGYAMSPRGRILGIASPDPIASWSLDYEGTGGRIGTLNLDLLHTSPLPPRHPMCLGSLAPGQREQWTIFLQPLGKLTDVKTALSQACAAPMIDLSRHTIAQGESVAFVVYSDEEIAVRVGPPSGRLRRLMPVAQSPGSYRFRYRPDEWPGVYRLLVQSAGGKRAEARVCMRRPWSWYLQQARTEALRCRPRASTHAESWYGLFSLTLAKTYFPDAGLDAQGERLFREIFPLLFDPEQRIPRIAPHRLQNTAAMCSLLADRYRSGGNLDDLQAAADLVDYLLAQQGDDGAYYNGRNHGTSVGCVAKSIMEVMAEEKRLAGQGDAWQQRYRRHDQSLKAAMDDLVRRRDNLPTRPEPTFEDGPISCSATQLAMFALLQDDLQLRSKYAGVARDLMRAHRCLTQLAVPDCRMYGATLRHGDSQCDVLMRPDMTTSPHGCSAWRIYGLWYLYLLSGEEAWLREAYDALGTCVGLVDSDTGRLRWAFVVDPYVEADAFVNDSQRDGHGCRKRRVLGEKYVEMISDWWQAPSGEAVGGYWGQGGCCDNSVHEIFKCLEEVALCNACVVERPSGEVVGYNCRVKTSEGRLLVTPYEPIVSAVHVNLRSPRDVVVQFSQGPVAYHEVTGMQWLRP